MTDHRPLYVGANFWQAIMRKQKVLLRTMNIGFGGKTDALF